MDGAQSVADDCEACRVSFSAWARRVGLSLAHSWCTRLCQIGLNLLEVRKIMPILRTELLNQVWEVKRALTCQPSILMLWRSFRERPIRRDVERKSESVWGRRRCSA